MYRLLQEAERQVLRQTETQRIFREYRPLTRVRDTTGPGTACKPDTALLICSLEDEVLYTQASAVRSRYEKGAEYRKLFARLRVHVCNAGMTKSPDAMVKLQGQWCKAWWGTTWKESVSDKSYDLGLSLLLGEIELPPQPEKLTKALPEEEEEQPAPLQRSTPEALTSPEPPVDLEIGEAPPTKMYLARSLVVKWLPFKRSLLAALALLIILTAAGTATAVYRPNINDIRRQDGMRGMVAYLAGRHPKNDQERRDYAYLAYRQGDFSEAERRNMAILAERGISDKLRADINYQLGLVYSAWGHQSSAVAKFGLAQELYLYLDRPANLYHVCLNRARSLMILGQFDEARTNLADAFMYFEASEGVIVHPGKLHLVEAQVALREGDYHLGREAAASAVRLFEEALDRDNAADALAFLGLFHGLLGETGNCQLFTTRAQKMIFEQHNAIAFSGTLINALLMNKLHGLEPDPEIIGAIMPWAKLDSEISFQLELVLKFSPGVMTHEDFKAQ